MIPFLPPPKAEPCQSQLLPARMGARGDLLDPVVCAARPQFGLDGKPKKHRGKHRAYLGRVRVRWTDAEAHL